MGYREGIVALVACTLIVLCSPALGKKVPPKCCLPDTFEVFLGQEGGTNAGCSGDVYTYEYIFDYDLPNRRWGLISGKNIVITGDWSGHMLVEDFEDLKIIRGGLTPRLGPSCRIEAMSSEWEMKRFCLPEDATYKETVTMGYGEDSFSYDIFSWEDDIYDFQDIKYRAHYLTGVTEDCTFINEIAMWKGEKFNNTINVGFFDLKEKLSPVNVFNEIPVTFGVCKEEEIGDLFDVYRSIQVQYIGSRVRNTPPPPPKEEEGEESENTESS